MKMMTAMLAMLAIVALSGCALLQDVDPNSKRLAIQYATLKVVDGDQDKAARVLELIERGRQYLNDEESITIAAIDGSVRELIRWDNMDNADRILVDNILLTARKRLMEEIGAGILDTDQKEKVLIVFNWVEESISNARL
jgi:hypothetical protein